MRLHLVNHRSYPPPHGMVLGSLSCGQLTSVWRVSLVVLIMDSSVESVIISLHCSLFIIENHAFVLCPLETEFEWRVAFLICFDVAVAVLWQLLLLPGVLCEAQFRRTSGARRLHNMALSPQHL